MDEAWILLLIGLLLSPFFLSILALVKLSNLRKDVDALRRRIDHAHSEPVPQVCIPPRMPAVTTAPQESVVAPGPHPPPLPPMNPMPPPIQPTASIAEKNRPQMEFALGGKVAAYTGAAILLMGIAFLVGFAIQHSWMGLIVGLLCGGALVGTGYGLERRSGGTYGFLARALTGAGGALFFFVVFAAYGIYHLIGVSACGVGLFASALAVFGLSMVYNSQAVGLLGVLGAFITPLLIGGNMERGIFPLIYVAVINLPVFLLGVRRKWQLLYNLSFAFTVFYFFAWLTRTGAGDYLLGLLFAVIYFCEFAILGLLKLHCEQQITGRRADSARLLSASLLLLWAVSWILEKADWDSWRGLTFLVLAVLHIGLAALARRILSRYTEDILAFLGGGLLFAVLALPAQLDGEWVSLGWALEGVVLAWFASRVQSGTLRGIAVLIGMIGIMKALCFDVRFYSQIPSPFLNVRFAVGIISCGLLGLQGWLAGRFPIQEKSSNNWRDGLWWIGIIAGLLMFIADAFWTIGFSNEWAWVLISMILLTVGSVLTLIVHPGSSIRLLGKIIILLIPIQIAFFYLLLGSGISSTLWTPLWSPTPWLMIAILGVMAYWIQPRITRSTETSPQSAQSYGLFLTMAALACALLILTLEFGRLRTEWSGTLITVLWAVWALTLTLFGLMRRRAPYRTFGLLLFGLTTLKVLFVDSSKLGGLERIVACMGTGVLLLILSFIYLKVAPRFLSSGDDQ